MPVSVYPFIHTVPRDPWSVLFGPFATTLSTYNALTAYKRLRALDSGRCIDHPRSRATDHANYKTEITNRPSSSSAKKYLTWSMVYSVRTEGRRQRRSITDCLLRATILALKVHLTIHNDRKSPLADARRRCEPPYPKGNKFH